MSTDDAKFGLRSLVAAIALAALVLGLAAGLQRLAGKFERSAIRAVDSD